MAIVTVTSLLDNTAANDGAISLREAMIALNNNDAAGNSDFAGITFDNTNDEIQFAGLTGTIVLGGTELAITEALTLTGPGADTLTIDADEMSRVINVTGNAPLTVARLTLRGGNVTGDGGGILSNGEVNLTNSIVSGNTSTDRGGGVYTPRAIALTNSSVSGNYSNGNGGGLYGRNGNISLTDSTVSGNESKRYGGGVYARGQITVTNSTVSGNSSRRNGGGLYSRSGNISLTDSTVSGNFSNRHGGGIWARSRTITLTNSTVSGNSSRLSAGGMYSTTANIIDSVVSNNSSGDLGGGVYATGTVNLTNSTISGNSSTNKGGGIYFRNNLTSTNSTISGNSSNRGGGIYSRGGGTVNLTNSTISGNSSTNRGGGIFARGRNGGTIEIYNSTIADNEAGGDGGGIFRNGGTIHLMNAIVATNIATGSGNDLSGTFNTIENSLIGDTAGATITNDTNNLTGVDPQLLPLGDYGGDTQTHALELGSPAIDASGASAAANDQRGIAAFGTRDIGAFEAIPEIDITGNNIAITDGDTSPDIADGTDFGSTNISGGTLVRTFTLANLGNIDLNLNGSPLVSLGGANAADFSITALPTTTIAPGENTTFQVSFDPSAVGTRTATVSIASNDSDENPYTFDIQGTGNEIPPIVNPPVTPDNPITAPSNDSPGTPDNPITLPSNNSPGTPDNPITLPSHPNPATPDPLPNVRLILDQLEIRLPDFPTTGICGNDGNNNDDLLLGDENANALCGLLGDDILAGFAQADRLDGNDGNDIIFGNTGNDTIDGGTGDDLIFAGQDDDLVTGGDGIDEIVGDFGSDTLDGNSGNDVIFGNRGADVLDGDDGDDVLFGGRDNDIVTGGTGNDVVRGDLGDDLLIGGAGGDRFDFRAGDGVDVVADFTDGVDIIGLLDGLTFADVTIAQVGNDTQISATGLVVTLQNVNVGAIDSNDFATV